MTRTSTPSDSFRSSSAAVRVPTAPSRQPNMRMCTDDRAASMSARIRGKKVAPSTRGSSVAAVDHANSSVASRGRTRSRAANAAVADSRGIRRDRAGARRPARPPRDPENPPVRDDEQSHRRRGGGERDAAHQRPSSSSLQVAVIAESCSRTSSAWSFGLSPSNSSPKAET